MTMAMTSLSIVLTVFVLQLHHVGPHTKPVPMWIRKLVLQAIARCMCMTSHVEGYYRYQEESRKDEMCLTSFMDSVDFKDSNNCNGRLQQTSGSSGFQYFEGERQSASDRNVTYDKISRHLKILVSKQEGEDDHQEIVNEWRLVAHVMDRFLFWLFLIGSFLSSIVILVFKPMMKPNLAEY